MRATQRSTPVPILFYIKLIKNTFSFSISVSLTVTARRALWFVCCVFIYLLFCYVLTKDHSLGLRGVELDGSKIKNCRRYARWRGHSLLTLWRVTGSTFLSNASWYPTKHCFVESSQASVLCPSRKTSMQMKISMEHLLNNNDWCHYFSQWRTAGSPRTR